MTCGCGKPGAQRILSKQTLVIGDGKQYLKNEPFIAYRCDACWQEFISWFPRVNCAHCGVGRRDEHPHEHIGMCCDCFDLSLGAPVPRTTKRRRATMKAARNIDHMFRNLVYKKSAADIVEAAKRRAERLRAKVEERQGRLTALRHEYGINDAALVQLLTAARKQAHELMSYSYSSQNVGSSGGGKMEERTIGAGVVNNLLTESDFIESERDQIASLELIARNLKPIARYAPGNGTELPPEEFTLTQEELEYLDF